MKRPLNIKFIKSLSLYDYIKNYNKTTYFEKNTQNYFYYNHFLKRIVMSPFFLSAGLIAIYSNKSSLSFSVKSKNKNKAFRSSSPKA